MVADDPESFADLDGHFSTPIFGEASGGCSGREALGVAECAADEMARAEAQHDKNVEEAWAQADGAAKAKAAQHPRAHSKKHSSPKLPGTKLQRQIYRETAGLRGPGLHAARVAIAQTRILNHSHEAIAKDFNPNKPQDAKELSAIVHNPEAAAIFADVGKAISEATTAPDYTNGATHFVLNYGQDLSNQKWYTGGSIEKSYGPFENTAGGDVPRGESVDIEIVSYPPHF